MGHHGAALQAAISLAFVMPAAAQPAPNARPMGGQVVAGSASITNGAAATTINQASNRAAIDWRSFDVGSNQSVIFNQPGASSVTLNRVTGPDPSAIAGKITANGRLVLTNPSGVVFHAGAQVNAQSVIVSAPGITNQNFMAGRMVFDQAGNPNARVENAGAITVKQAGLAALVAPSVANSGTITARLGHVVLAGAAAHTLDMYGDGLVAIDITKQVTQAPVGPGGKPVTALVTNSGTIAADGGTVQLSARAADGVVNTLVQAGGRIQANTAGGRAGQIEIAGTGGSVVIEGRVAADGRAPGTVGGSVAVAGSDATIIAPAARVTANGRAGGGTVAIGTSLARARSSGPAPAGTSARTVVAAGARISADATKSGDGGRVTVLSTQSTTMAGAATARGGKSGGNGGAIELSGETGFRLTGTADTSAPHGALGTILLDPRDLFITDNPPAGTRNQPPGNGDPNIAANAGGTTTDAYVTPDQLENLFGNIHVLTTRDLSVTSPLTSGSATNITLEAGRNLTVSSTISAAGNLTLIAASATVPGYDPTGLLSIGGAISGQSIMLSAGTGGIALGANVTASTALGITTPGNLTQSVGVVTTPQLYGTAGSVTLVGSPNQIAGIGNGQNASFQTTSGNFFLTEAVGQSLTVGTTLGGGGLFVPAGQAVNIAADQLTLSAPAGASAITAVGGTVTFLPADTSRAILVSATDSSEGGALYLSPTELGLLNVGTLQLGQSTVGNGGITLGGTNESIDLTSVGIGALALGTPGDITQGGPLTVASLSINVGINGSVTLTNSGNQIGALSLIGNDNLAVSTAGDLLLGTVGVDDATISANGSITQTAGTLSSSDGLSLIAGSLGGISLGGTVTVANTLSLSAGTGGVTLSGSVRATVLNVSTDGPLLQNGGSLAADTLTGNASAVSLPSTGNALNGVSDFTVTAGNFLLVSSVPTTVAPPIGSEDNFGLALPTGGTATFVTDYLSITNGGRSDAVGISASGGSVIVAPFTAGGAVLLTSGAKPSTGLSLTTSELALVDASSLQLGGTGSVPAAGAITIGQAGDSTIDLGSLGFTRLTLGASGAVTQNAGLGVTTLAGTAGSLLLGDANNYITELNGLTTTAGDLALHTSAGLTVSGTVAATGTVFLSTSGTAGLSLGADVSGVTVRFDTTDGYGNAYAVDQTAGIVTAGTLTGVASTLTLPQPNQIANLGDFTTQGILSITNAGALAVTGTVSAGVVTLNAAGITQTPGSSITAVQFSGSSTADTVLDSRLNAIPSVTSFTQSVGNFTLVTSVGNLDLGTVTATTGSLNFVADQVGLASSPNVSATAGVVSFSPFTPSRPIVLVDTANPGPNVLALSTNFLTYVHADTLALGSAGYAGPITFGGANETLDLSAFRGVQVQTTGAVTQGQNSVWTVSSLYGTAGSISLPGSLPGNNNVSALGLGVGGAPVGLTATAGALTLGTVGNVTLYGPVSATTAVTLSTGTRGGLTVAGTLSAPSVTLLTGGTLSQMSTSQISANNLLITAQSASLGGTGNRIGTLMSVISGDLTLSSATGLTIAGGSTVGGTLTLAVAGAVTGGPIGTQALTGNAGSVALTAADNRIDSLGPFTSTSGFILVDALPLTVTGTVSDPTAISLNVSGDLTLAGTLSSPQGVVTLSSTGNINQTGGTLTAGTLTGASAGSATLGQAGNLVGTLAGFTTGGDFTLVDGRSLVVSAPVDPNTISMTIRGDLTLNSSVTGGTVALNVTGALTEGPGGQIVADTLTGAAASATLNGANQIATLGGLATATGFSLTNTGALTLAGPMSDGRSISIATSGPLTLAGNVSAPAIAFSAGGDITQTAGSLAATNTLTVSAAGALTQVGGAFAAGTLSGSADSIDIGRGGPAAIGQIAGLAATGASPGTLTVLDNMPLQVSGTISGRFVSITAAGSLTLSNGTVILTDGQPASAQLGSADASPGSNLSVTPGSDGRATLTLLGTVTVAPLTAPAATLRLDLPAAGGRITLTNLQAGDADLVLSLGSGAATGTLVARNLTVLGASGQATLSGTVRGLTGTQAAGTASLLPGLDPRYTLNGCTISLSSCSGATTSTGTLTTITGFDLPSIFQPDALLASLTASAISSVIRPDILALDVLDLSVTRDRDDPTLLLPNISDKDY